MTFVRGYEMVEAQGGRDSPERLLGALPSELAPVDRGRQGSSPVFPRVVVTGSGLLLDEALDVGPIAIFDGDGREMPRRMVAAQVSQ